MSSSRLLGSGLRLLTSLVVFLPTLLSAGSALGIDLTHTTTALSQARLNLAATSVGGYALFAGGRANHVGNTNIVDIFNAMTGQWSTATLAQGRYDLAAASVGQYALFAGGYGNGSETSMVDIFVVPEPAALSLLGFGAFVLIRKSKIRRGSRGARIRSRSFSGSPSRPDKSGRRNARSVRPLNARPGCSAQGAHAVELWL